MSTRAQLLALIDDLLGGGSPKVTKAEHQPVLDDLVNSLLNLEDDNNLLGLLQHDPSRTYAQGEGVFKDGQLWQANENIPIEAWNVSKWTQITGFTSLSDYEIPEWEDDFPSGSGTGYPLDAQVVRDDRLWRSDSNDNTDDPLDTGWTEISANDGVFGNTWVVGNYKQNQVVTNPNDYKLYYLAEPTPTPQGFYSADITVEIGTGKWVLFHDVSSAISGTENNMVRFNAGGNFEETDEIQVETGATSIKTLLQLLTGAKIGKVNEDGDVLVRLSTDVALVFSADNGMYITGKNDFTKGWAGADDNGAGIGFGVDYVNIDNSGNWNFTANGFLCTLVKTAITGPRTYAWPNVSGTIALFEQLIRQQSETVTTPFAPGGVYAPIPGASYVTVNEGDWRITYEAFIQGTGDYIANFDLFQNGAPGGPAQGTFRSIAGIASGGGTHSGDQMISITKTLVGVPGLTTIDIQAQTILGTVNVLDGIFRVEKMNTI